MFEEVTVMLKFPESMWYAVNQLRAGEGKTPREAEPCSGHCKTGDNVLHHPPDTVVAKFCDPASKYLMNSMLPQPQTLGFPVRSEVILLMPIHSSL